MKFFHSIWKEDEEIFIKLKHTYALYHDLTTLLFNMKCQVDGNSGNKSESGNFFKTRFLRNFANSQAAL